MKDFPTIIQTDDEWEAVTPTEPCFVKEARRLARHILDDQTPSFLCCPTNISRLQLNRWWAIQTGKEKEYKAALSNHFKKCAGNPQYQDELKDYECDKLDAGLAKWAKGDGVTVARFVAAAGRMLRLSDERQKALCEYLTEEEHEALTKAKKWVLGSNASIVGGWTVHHIRPSPDDINDPEAKARVEEREADLKRRKKIERIEREAGKQRQALQTQESRELFCKARGLVMPTPEELKRIPDWLEDANHPALIAQRAKLNQEVTDWFKDNRDKLLSTYDAKQEGKRPGTFEMTDLELVAFQARHGGEVVWDGEADRTTVVRQGGKVVWKGEADRTTVTRVYEGKTRKTKAGGKTRVLRRIRKRTALKPIQGYDKLTGVRSEYSKPIGEASEDYQGHGYADDRRYEGDGVHGEAVQALDEVDVGLGCELDDWLKTEQKERFNEGEVEATPPLIESDTKRQALPTRVTALGRSKAYGVKLTTGQRKVFDEFLKLVSSGDTEDALEWSFDYRLLAVMAHGDAEVERRVRQTQAKIGKGRKRKETTARQIAALNIANGTRDKAIKNPQRTFERELARELEGFGDRVFWGDETKG